MNTPTPVFLHQTSSVAVWSWSGTTVMLLHTIEVFNFDALTPSFFSLVYHPARFVWVLLGFHMIINLYLFIISVLVC